MPRRAESRTASKSEKEGSLAVGGHSIYPGERVRLDLPVALLPTHTQLHLPIEVLNGLEPGPRIWLSAAVHGDELNGVEIIRQVLARMATPLERGVIFAVPIVNVFGFINQSRYLPDRRDLNRSFPGSRHGSLASRIAHMFMKEVVSHCTYGIDLHTASLDRSNLPQIRANLEDPETLRLARAFGAPVMVHSSTRDGSLRAAAGRRGIPTLLFEGGEPQRFNDSVIESGVCGVLAVLAELGLASPPDGAPTTSIHLSSTSWIRARRGGVLRLLVNEGDEVSPKQELGVISDPLGDEQHVVRATDAGLVIGMTKNPVVHGGDAILHIGRRKK